MRLMIDYQGAQSGGSRNRGIGRYTASITRAIIRSAPEAEVLLLLNGAFDETVAQIRAEFEDVLPRENIIVWRPLTPIAHIESRNDDRRRASELLREAVVARHLPDALLITSHFEGSGDDGATTIGLLPTAYPTAVILYDLIPYIYRPIYLRDPAVERWYEERLGSLKRADLLLAISESSRQEAIDYLGYPADRALNISTAADVHFRRMELSDSERDALFARYCIAKPFVMYTGGIDHRKNIEGLIRAFGKLPAKMRRKHQLVVICSMRSGDDLRLRQVATEAGLAADELVLTGFIPEEDLIALYSACKLFVFPSWHEGFGLPALEAMSCGAPVIAGNRSSLPEVLGDPAALFDPRDDGSIAEKVKSALGDDEFRHQLIENGVRRAAMFSWDKIGKRAVEALKEVIARGPRLDAPAQRSQRRPRMAIVTPAPPAHTGIAYYAATLIRSLHEFYDIDVVLSDGATTDDPFIAANCNVIGSTSFRNSYEWYERVVYQFGNSDHHSHMVDLIQDYPGVLVLHDFFVSDLSSWREHLGGVHGNWAHDLYESHGIGAVLERHDQSQLFSVINKYPCSFAVTRHALGVLCHSDEARSLQVAWHGAEAAQDWAVIPMIRSTPRLPARTDARHALGIKSDEFVVCAFGILGTSKLNHRLIEAWIESALGRDKRCRLFFVGGHGAEDYYAELRDKVQGDKAAARVEFTGWVNNAEYIQYLSAADVAVQLRGVTHGETSAATLDAMLSGIPVIANMSPSLPRGADDAIAYISAEASAADLADALERMYRDRSLRSEIGQAGQRYAKENHCESVCGRKFAEAVEEAYRRSTATLNAAVAELAGLRLSEAEASHLADEFAGLLSQRATLYVDITALLPSLPETFEAKLGPFLRDLAEEQPTLRVVPVERVEGAYWSALHSVLRAAKHPHVHDHSERIILKSVDQLVAMRDEDVAFAEEVARTAGAVFLAVSSSGDADWKQLQQQILHFAASATSSAGIARHFSTSLETGRTAAAKPRKSERKHGKRSAARETA